MAVNDVNVATFCLVHMVTTAIPSVVASPFNINTFSLYSGVTKVSSTHHSKTPLRLNLVRNPDLTPPMRERDFSFPFFYGGGGGGGLGSRLPSFLLLAAGDGKLGEALKMTLLNFSLILVIKTKINATLAR